MESPAFFAFRNSTVTSNDLDLSLPGHPVMRVQFALNTMHLRCNVDIYWLWVTLTMTQVISDWTTKCDRLCRFPITDRPIQVDMSDLKNAYAKIGASASRMTPNCVTCEWKTKWKATQLMSSISNFAVFLNYLSDGLWSLNEYSYRSEHDLISVLRYARIATQGSLYCITTGLSVSILFIIRDTALAMSLSTRPAIVAGQWP